MPIVTYVRDDGAQASVDVPVGSSVMRGAKDNGIEGIEADCGGVCACATCHVYVDPEWTVRVGPPGEDEKEMLECTNDPRPNSRLSCQIAVQPELSGLVVRLPDSQR